MTSPQPEPSTSALTECVKPNPKRLPKPVERLIKRVADKCKKESLKQTDLGDVWTRAERLTGIEKGTLEKICISDTYSNLLHANKEFDRSLLHRTLLNFYLEMKIMPTTKEMLIASREFIDPLMNIRGFRRLLHKMGYNRKKVSNRYVVVENPTITMERYNYLHNIIKYRKKYKSIFFIGAYTFNCQGKLLSSEDPNTNPKYTRVLFAVSSKIGAGRGVSFSYVPDFSEDNFHVWLHENLFPELHQNSVVVIEDNMYKDQVLVPPDAFSLKHEMEEWLEYKGVPFEKGTPKFMLYELINNATDTDEKLYKLDTLMEAYGHKILRLPKCIKDLSPAYFVAKSLEVDIKVLLSKCANSVSISKNYDRYEKMFYSIMNTDWLRLNRDIALEEEYIFKKDRFVDQTYEELLENLSQRTIAEDQSDSDISDSDDE